MVTRNSVVEINGNRYDAATGKIISTIKTANQNRSQVIDGFIKAPRKPATARSSSSRSKQFIPSRQQIKSSDFHQTAQRAQTLMRSGLKKPARQLHSQLHRLTPSSKIETELRAKTTLKHARVNRFGIPAAHRVRLAAKAPRPALSGEVVRANLNSSKAVGSAAAPLPSMITSASHQRLERLLDEALTRADAHKQALRYQAARHFWQRRWFSGSRRWLVVVGFLLILSGCGIFAWRAFPQLSVKVAGFRAHLGAVLPSYKPEGYKIASPAGAASGKVTISYKSKINPAQTYDIIQTTSNLTSSLLAQDVVPKGAAVQTSQVEGNTVYIYGSTNDAAWVNNGILYTIKDKASLSSDELLNIVKGINP